MGKPLLAADGFKLKASNGYTIAGVALENPKDGSGVLLLGVGRKGASVLYEIPATVTATSIDADLGRLGAIDVHFVPTGGTTTERSTCGGRPVSFDSGDYIGRIDFEGELGYTRLHLTRARGEIQGLLSLLCAAGRSEGIGGRAPGARLTARRRGSEAPFEFAARKNSPTGRADFAVSIDERSGEMAISRSVETVAPPNAFVYDTRAGTATIRPPAPFSGSATYSRHSAIGGWAGDLSVDFPGRSDVKLGGPQTHVSLVRSEKSPLFGGQAGENRSARRGAAAVAGDQDSIALARPGGASRIIGTLEWRRWLKTLLSSF
ncbi:MAG TPA: hypothetical protein VII45_09190 [Solirubrobacterales bacterium]